MIPKVICADALKEGVKKHILSMAMEHAVA
jgi:hypothetical protein